ncbi:hypothetical protein V8C86DRAFT_2497527 [Haematococcus lacustris]
MAQPSPHKALWEGPPITARATSPQPPVPSQWMLPTLGQRAQSPGSWERLAWACSPPPSQSTAAAPSWLLTPWRPGLRCISRPWPKQAPWTWWLAGVTNPAPFLPDLSTTAASALWPGSWPHHHHPPYRQSQQWQVKGYACRLLCPSWGTTLETQGHSAWTHPSLLLLLGLPMGQHPHQQQAGQWWPQQTLLLQALCRLRHQLDQSRSLAAV